jgi:hypothetical protein
MLEAAAAVSLLDLHNQVELVEVEHQDLVLLNLEHRD